MIVTQGVALPSPWEVPFAYMSRLICKCSLRCFLFFGLVTLVTLSRDGVCTSSKANLPESPPDEYYLGNCCVT